MVLASASFSESGYCMTPLERCRRAPRQSRTQSILWNQNGRSISIVLASVVKKAQDNFFVADGMATQKLIHGREVRSAAETAQNSEVTKQNRATAFGF